ncbi:SUMO-targeted ubiquitin ligase complex subunit slx8 [Myotisia sp. PD_48]|nr:SUMO-targeted ubiquitin ligase complex subunit slx8 [Myotisia sp. PD_48]
MNSFVDLTSSSPHGDPDRPERPSSRIRNRRPISISPLEYPQHSVKRRRIDNDNSTGEFQFCDEEDVAIEREEIQSVDLTGVNDSSGLSKIIARQHEDAIRAQKAAAKEPPARSALIAYKCPICMDVAENATTTICAKNGAQKQAAKRYVETAPSVEKYYPG